MQVTAVLLADGAQVANGKLYVLGGAWDTIFADSAPYVHPAMAVALVLRVEYLEALQNIPLVIELVDEDEQPVGPRIEGVLNVGHAPGTKPGSAANVPQALTVNGLQFPKLGEYRFRVTSKGKELASVSFRLAPKGLPPTPN